MPSLFGTLKTANPGAKLSTECFQEATAHRRRPWLFACFLAHRAAHLHGKDMKDDAEGRCA